MRAIRFALAVCVAMLAQPASAVFYPYEAAGGGEGVNRSNNVADISPVGACSATVVGTTVTLLGCRDRTGAQCATGVACDLARVPEFRCSSTTATAVNCLWPNGAGFCNADPNRGCLVDGNCPSGTCNQSTNDPTCVCQGTNSGPLGGPTPADFESIVCGTSGICSDGDGLYAFAPTLHGGLATAINLGGGSANGTNAGRGAGQGFTGPRSGYENPPVLITGQRAPGLGDIVGVGSTPNVTPIVDLRATLVYDIGAIEPGRGGIRSIRLKGDSFWQDIPYGDQDITGAPVSSNGPTTNYFFAPANAVLNNPTWYYNQPTQGTCVGGANPGVVCIDAPTCSGTCVRTLYGHQAAIDTVGYIWTAAIPAGDYLPAGSTTTNLDVDADGQPDCPPHCGVDYDLDTLEQMTIEAANLIDVRAGAQLAFDFLVGGPAGAGDAIGAVSIESSTWASGSMPDMRCFMGGDAAVVCSTCGSVTPGFCGATNLACTTTADCQQYVGRCSSGTGLGNQQCDPLDNGTNPARTDCPVGQSCHACYGPVAVGACIGGTEAGSACRVNSDCDGPGTCGADIDGAGLAAGAPYYPEVPGPNPLGLPPGYNTYGFSELELDVKCNLGGPGIHRLGRIGQVSPMAGAAQQAPGRTVAVPLAFISTTGKAASQVVDLDVSGGLNDDAIFGRVTGAQIGIAEPGAPATPLSGGTFAAGRIFPVDPTGPACCNGGGNILTTKNTNFGNARANTSVNGAGAITWAAGAQGTITTALMRGSAWGPGANRTPGCIGDNSEVTGGSAFPDPNPCNDPLGSVISDRCTGDNCTDINTGADDPRVMASIGGAPAVGVIAARTKNGNPASQTPIIYSVGGLTGIDIDIGAPFGESNTDFSSTVETFNCPMLGTCATGGAQCALDSDCAGGANGPCQNREKVCPNIFCPPDTDGDGITCGDNCPNNANANQANFDGDALGDACDTCETVVNTGLNTDGDTVDNACDTCTNVTNAPIAGNPTATRSFISHQRDDDTDGLGNHCDFNYNQSGLTIDAADFNAMKASFSKGVTLATCGLAPTNNQRCGEFDHNGAGLSIDATDFNLAKGAFSKAAAQPKCTACTVGTGWSNTLASGGERLGRPVCQSAVVGACVYAP